jgi:hypothetical protein
MSERELHAACRLAHDAHDAIGTRPVRIVAARARPRVARARHV